MADAKPDAKPEAKPEAKPDAKPDAKPAPARAASGAKRTKKIVEAEHERSKEILVAKFQKIDQGLAAMKKTLERKAA